MRVPNAVFGCTNATVVPRLPGRGSSSITRCPSALTRAERGGAVVDPVADVVQALTSRCEGLRYRRVVADRAEQLDVRVGHREQRLLDAVALDDLSVLDLASKVSR